MSNKKSFETRFYEILPGALTWVTLLGAPILSYLHPVWVSVYIIAFDLYWFLKGGNVALHLVHSYDVLKTHDKIDWLDWCMKLSDKDFLPDLEAKSKTDPKRSLRNLYADYVNRIRKIKDGRSLDWRRIHHLIIIPMYKEGLSVLEPAIASYANADYPNEKLILYLAVEERAGEESLNTARYLSEKFADKFSKISIVVHPDGIEGEAKGKGSNITYAAKDAWKYLQDINVAAEDVLVSAFDSDTTVSKNYYAHLTFDFLTLDKPFRASYQPMPVFHNNIWDTPAIARVIATSSSFWQLVEASRPDRLITFSSHSMSLKTLIEVGFWRVDIIPEDSHIFWQCFLHFSGDYKTHPLFTTVSMDAVLGESYVGTLIAQYKQKRRWAWGVTEIAMDIPKMIKDPKMPLWKKIIYSERLIEGHYFWATASIMIAVLGWLPLIFGGARFGTTVVAVNLPVITRTIMSVATFFLIFSMYINMVILPPRPKGYPRWKTASMLLQWVFSPIVSSVFGSLPAIDAQTRLMFGKYMEFWVTPKIRKAQISEKAESDLKYKQA